MLQRSILRGWSWPLYGLAAFVLFGCTNPSQPKPTLQGQLPLKDCHLPTKGSMLLIPAQCGSMDVPENWDKPQGKKIKIYFAVLPAQKKKSKPDPMFFFAGGPGQAATESYHVMMRGFARINQVRDIVLIDQRGTGRSSPIRCDASVFKDMTKEPSDAELMKWIKGCAARQKKQLEYYRTVESIKDFNAVRKALGYKTINLYGISYGTRVAQSYMRVYASHVRSVILDGVAPQTMPLGREIFVYGPERVKRWVIARCKADKACNKAFPKLAESIAAVEKVIKEKQPVVEMIHPRTNQRFKAKLTWSTWGLGFRLFGYSSAMVAVLPLLIHNSHKTKDVRPLFKWVMAQVESVQELLGQLENSVLCAEDVPFLSAKKKAEASPTGYGEKRLKTSVLLCKSWPHKVVSADFKKPVVSSIPTLLLSGQYDPVTPPSYASQVAKHLSHHLEVVVPGEGHGVVGLSCVPKLAEQFVQQASVKKLKPDCVKQHKPTGFFIDFAGPEVLQ